MYVGVDDLVLVACIYTFSMLFYFSLTFVRYCVHSSELRFMFHCADEIVGHCCICQVQFCFIDATHAVNVDLGVTLLLFMTIIHPFSYSCYDCQARKLSRQHDTGRSRWRKLVKDG